MKILIVTVGHYLDQPSGAAKIAYDEAVELKRRGEDVWMLAPGVPLLPEHELLHGIHVLRYTPQKVSPWSPARRSAHRDAAAVVLARHLPEVDAIHGFVPLQCAAALEFYGDSVYSCYTICSPAKMEMAIEWRNSGFLRRLMAPVGLPFINRLEAECLRRSDLVIAMSQYTISCMETLHDRELTKKMRLIPGWVETSCFTPARDREQLKVELKWPTNVPVFFTLRRLVPRMGLGRLIDACRILAEEGNKFHLLIGGSGPLRGELKAQVQKLGLEGVVTFLGRIEDNELPLAYAACDAFVLPTAELECFGLIALEALAAGRPVLATPIGAIPEIIRKFEPSWLARSAESTDIADLLRRYLKNELPEHSSSDLHDQVCRDYSTEMVLGELIQAVVEGYARHGSALSSQKKTLR